MISALVTIYNPEDIVASNVRTISNQVDRIFLCDNSPSPNAELFESIPNAIYIFNHENYALSKAFNVILKNPDYNWTDMDYIVFFDQDSTIRPGHIEGLICEYNKLKTDGVNVGCIGPIYYNLNTKSLAIPRVKKQISDNSYIVSSIITSSLLCQFKSLKEIGFWNESIFLDLADWDLCWRMMQMGKVCIKTKVVVLEHALGYGVKKVGLLRLGKTAPIREYYQTRNYLYLLGEKYVPIKYKIKFLRNLTIRPILHYLYLDQKKERMTFVKAGYRDFYKKYYGEYK